MKRQVLKYFVVGVLALANISMATSAAAAERVEVSSIEALIPYLKQDNVDLVMTPGTYRVTEADMKAGKYPDTSEVEEGNIRSVILLIEGNHSTYDFTDVTIEIEAGVFTRLDNKYREFVNLQTLGNYNVIKNLKLVDIAERTDFPNKGCTNIMVDGAHNLLEGVEVRSTGSKPYGYGDMFGKGRSHIRPLKKHCGLLVRGDYNHIKGCKVIHYAFGHCLFMQGADHPTIEGCYIQSEMNSTDNVLAETAEDSDAVIVGFKSGWGYDIPKGYTFACSEEGIRAYITGNTMVDGVRYKNRATTNVTVKDCYIRNARAGVTLTHAGGTKYVENCTTIGCERGYAIGKGQIVNCKSDTQYGPALGVDYERDAGIEADITLLPNLGEPLSGNGSKHAAYIIGSNHKIRFRKGQGLDSPEQDLLINIGGDSRTIGNLAKDENNRASNIEIINETGYPVVLDDNTSNVTVTSLGAVTDEGSANTIKPFEERGQRR